MNQQSISTESSPVKSNLIHLESDVKRINRATDINKKINLLETSLTALQQELGNVNRSVEQGIDRLSDKDLDLTAKVSETYKRLGEIDGTYKSLSKISDDISDEVKKLANEMSEVAVKSVSGLNRLETQSSAQIKKTNDEHEQLAIRVNHLIQHSRNANSELSNSIKDNTDALLMMEKNLATEIDALANITEARNSELSSELDEAKSTIEKNTARIVQMQSVDEALSRRATTLEITAAELTANSQKLESSVNLLDVRTKDLTDRITQLKEQNEQHASLITGLHQTTKDITSSLLALTNIERNHFSILSGALLLVLLLITTLFIYQKNVTEENFHVNEQITTNLQQQNAITETQIAELQSEFKTVNEKLLDINDQAESMNGRLNRISPRSQFGVDNVIHGPQWLAKQPGENLVIQLSTVSNKNQLYEIAQRYSHYLKDQMAYYSVANAAGEKYVLTYGSFRNNADVSAALYRMPRSINFQRPIVKRISDIKSRYKDTG